MRRAEAQVLVLLALGLTAFGLVMVYSATSTTAALDAGDPASFVKRQGIYAVLGLALLLAAARFDHRHLRAIAPVLVVVSIALCALVLVLGPVINGARRWFVLGPASFQPSELAKLALAVWVAAYLSRKRPRSLGELARPLGLVTAVFAGLIMLQPDLGTTISLLAMVGAVLLVAGVPLGTLAAGGGAAAVLGALAIWAEPYRRERFLAFLDPWRDADDSGFQIIQALIALASGGLVGEGLGQSVQKAFYLPEAHTDMIFAIVGEELGLLGTAPVILAYAGFTLVGLRIALGCRDLFGKLLATALTTLVAGQAAINLAAVLGLAPLTGIPLPFVSYGGSNLVVQLAAVGILLNIATDGRGAARAAVPGRGRRDGRARAARAGGRGRAAPPRRARDVGGVARAGRGAARS